MGMQWYVARRLMWVAFAAWFALTITFLLLAFSPKQGELQAAVEAAQSGQDTEEAREKWRKQEGLDTPMHERYVNWFAGFLGGNWGWSNNYNQPVLDIYIEKWPFSAQYFIPSILITVLVGYGLGLYSAMNQYTNKDYVATFLAYFGLSIPNFWFGVMGILILGVWAQQSKFVLPGFDFTTFQAVSYDYTNLVSIRVFYSREIPILKHHVLAGIQVPYPNFKNLQQIAIPIVVYTTAGWASHMRYSRAQALEYANSEFVKTAKAKGATGWRILTRHILRVALVPLMTILVADVLALFLAASFIIEAIFAIPGIGLATYNAFISQDTPLVMATTLIGVFLAIFGNLLQDLAYVWLDPRIDYGDR